MIVCRIGYGLGGKTTSGGMDQLVTEIKQAYPQIDVRANSDSVDALVQELNARPLGDKIILIGYSRGADQVTIIASRLKRGVSYVAALQPSVYYPTTPVTSNIQEALCVYNPFWFETLGLGFNRQFKAEGNTVTQMEVIMGDDYHGGVQWNPVYHSKILRSIGKIVNQQGTQV